MKRKISKIEVATYLRDYSNLMILSSKNPDEKFFDLFKQMLIEDKRGQYAIKKYYYDMILIYEFFLVNRKYSFLSDIAFDFLLESNLSEITIPKDIFVNKEDSNKFSKKQIIKFIRNALNHNNNNELYSLYDEDGKIKVEIFLKNTKPIPFHVEMNLEDQLLKIMNGLRYSNKKDLIVYKTLNTLNWDNSDLNLELDKIFYRRFYYKNKVKRDLIDKICKEVKEEDDESLKYHLDEENISYVDYKLTLPQKLRILEALEKWNFFDKNILIQYLVTTVVPLGVTKVKLLNLSMTIAGRYVLVGQKSFKDISVDAKNLYFNVQDINNPLYDNKEEPITNFLLRVLDTNSHVSIALSIYYGYMLDTLIKEDYIKINEIDYPREKLRNSFVHGRWFNGINDCFKLYDCDNGDKNELNYNWRASLPINYFNEAMEFYYKNYINQNKIFSNFVPYVRIDDDKPISITLVKDNITYVCNLDVKSYIDEFIPWGLYKIKGNDLTFVESIEEADYFFDEVKKYIFKEESDGKNIMSLFKYQYRLCLRYKQGILSLEELNKNNKLILSITKNIDNNKKNSLNHLDKK